VELNLHFEQLRICTNEEIEFEMTVGLRNKKADLLVRK